MTMRAHRYAIYLAPVEPYRSFGSQWLGRDADTGMPLALPDAMAARPSRWVEAPAHYGLHATLKPPFRLAEGTDAAMLDAAARAFARDREPFRVPLTLRALRGFVAWCLADEGEGAARMHALADASVRDFERFRARATPAEVARRQPERLSPRQQQMLDAWGYPYVFETFTFHITLTGMLDAAEEAAALDRLSSVAGPLLATPLQVDGISVFVQPEPGAPFVAGRHYGFDGRTQDGAGAAYLPA
jgi:putative phosphonate metabolism protein